MPAVREELRPEPSALALGERAERLGLPAAGRHAKELPAGGEDDDAFAAPGESLRSADSRHLAHASARDPRSRSTFFSVRDGAKNAICRPSGDQKGRKAPSLPGTGREGRRNRAAGRTTDRPRSRAIGSTIFRPSGETAISAHCEPRLVRQDDLEADRQRLLWRLVTARHGEGDGGHGRRGGDRGGDPRRSGPGARATGPGRAAHARACFSSRTDCQRSAGSLARQVSTTCSSAGGVVGFRAEIGTGSRSRIAAITLAALLPSKACWPVSIS